MLLVVFDGMECIGMEDAEEVMITILQSRETSLTLSFSISILTYSTYNETNGMLPEPLSCDILPADTSEDSSELCISTYFLSTAPFLFYR